MLLLVKVVMEVMVIQDYREQKERKVPSRVVVSMKSLLAGGGEVIVKIIKPVVMVVVEGVGVVDGVIQVLAKPVLLHKQNLHIMVMMLPEALTEVAEVEEVERVLRVKKVKVGQVVEGKAVMDIHGR